MTKTVRIGAVSTVAFGVATALALAAPTNGNFETGTFKGWKTRDVEGSDVPLRSVSTGDWQVYKNKLKYPEAPMPRRGDGPSPKIAEPPQGIYAAGLASRAPGQHILHREISVSSDKELRLKLAYLNTNNDFVIGDGLNPEGGLDRRGDGGPNQQLRVDIMEVDAPIDSVAPEDIVLNVFNTQPGDDLKRDYFKLRTVLTEGEYRLRVAEVDNQGEFLVGVDAVKLKDA